jgi:hypothetical protein
MTGTVRWFLILVMAGVCILPAPADKIEGSPQQSVRPSPARGTWVWRKDSWLTAPARETLFEFLKRRGLSRIMVQIHTDFSGENPALSYQPEMAALLQEAARRGVEVYALDGGRNYIYEPWPGRLAGQIGAIADFNARQPEAARFKGVHYDIEPYTLPEARNPETAPAVWEAYLRTLKHVRRAARSHQLPLSVDIPFWFDTNPRVTEVCFEGKTTSLLEHVVPLVDWFTIMSYQNRATTVERITEGERALAGRLGKKAWVSVKVNPRTGNEPASTTFHGLPPAELDQQLREIEARLHDSPGFGGVLIHAYEHYRAYLGEAPPPEAVAP